MELSQDISSQVMTMTQQPQFKITIRISQPETDPVSNAMSRLTPNDRAKANVKFGINDSIVGGIQHDQDSSYYNETDSEFEEEVKNADKQINEEDQNYRSHNRHGLSQTMSTSNNQSKILNKVDKKMIHQESGEIPENFIIESKCNVLTDSDFEASNP